MNSIPDLHLTLTYSLRAACADPVHAENATERLARMIYRMNAQDGVHPPVRAPGSPLNFSMSAPLNAPHGGAIGALQVVQMLTLHLGDALTKHFGQPVHFEGSVTTGAVMEGGLFERRVNLGSVEDHRYTMVGSILRKNNDEIAFPDIVQRTRTKTAGSVMQDVQATSESQDLEAVAGGARSMRMRR